MRALIIAITSLCTACASLPSKDDIDAFSSATSGSAAVVKAAVTSSQQLAADQDEQLQAIEYVRGRPFFAAAIPESPQVKRLDNAQIAIRLAALNDLQAYAKALGKAADQGAVDELEASAQKLAGSVATLASAISPAASPVVAPAIQLTGRAISYAFAESYVRQVLRIVQDTDPTIKQLVDLLEEDLGPLPVDLWVQASTYAAIREAQLGTIRDDARVNRATLYDSYMQARSDIKARSSLSEAAAQVTDVLRSIYDTHHALAVGSADITLTIKRMTALANDVGAVLEAAKKDAGQ